MPGAMNAIKNVLRSASGKGRTLPNMSNVGSVSTEFIGRGSTTLAGSKGVHLGASGPTVMGGNPGYMGGGGALTRRNTSALTANFGGTSASLNPAAYYGAGAAAGGLYGAMSDDTSILGGAMMGASAVGMGRAGMGGYRSRRAGGSINRGIRNQMARDYQGAKLAANQGYGKIKGLYKRYT